MSSSRSNASARLRRTFAYPGDDDGDGDGFRQVAMDEEGKLLEGGHYWTHFCTIALTYM